MNDPPTALVDFGLFTSKRSGGTAMKILIADKFPDGGRTELIQSGFEIVYDPDLKDDGLKAAIASSGADILVVRGTKVSAEMLEAGRLSLVVAPEPVTTRLM